MTGAIKRDTRSLGYNSHRQNQLHMYELGTRHIRVCIPAKEVSAGNMIRTCAAREKITHANSATADASRKFTKHPSLLVLKEERGSGSLEEHLYNPHVIYIYIPQDYLSSLCHSP